jgi:hypothetical protein
MSDQNQPGFVSNRPPDPDPATLIGLPADDCVVPALVRKPFDEIEL